jgi:hypothetical protein
MPPCTLSSGKPSKVLSGREISFDEALTLSPTRGSRANLVEAGARVCRRLS